MRFKVITALPGQSIINPTKAQIFETTSHKVAKADTVRRLWTLPIGSRAVVYSDGPEPDRAYRHQEDIFGRWIAVLPPGQVMP